MVWSPLIKYIRLQIFTLKRGKNPLSPSDLEKLKYLDKDLYNLVENDDAHNIFKDEIFYVMDVVPAKKTDGKIESIVKSNKEATRSFFGEFFLP